MVNTSLATRSVFVAGPYKGCDRPRHRAGQHPPEVTAGSRPRVFDAAEYHVYDSHRRESWAAAMLTPTSAPGLDYEEIKSADLFVAFPGGQPASPGTHIEMGWASSLGEPMILIIDGLESHSFLVRGWCGRSRAVHRRPRDSRLVDELDRAAVDRVRQASEPRPFTV